jgi:hypothetical protein
MPNEVYTVELSRYELEMIRFTLNMSILERDIKNADVSELITLRDEITTRALSSRVRVTA